MACCSARPKEAAGADTLSAPAGLQQRGSEEWQPSNVDLAALKSVKVSDGSRLHSMESLLANDHVVVSLLLRRYG